jgi:hypothetical protein
MTKIQKYTYSRYKDEQGRRVERLSNLQNVMKPSALDDFFRNSQSQQGRSDDTATNERGQRIPAPKPEH